MFPSIQIDTSSPIPVHRQIYEACQRGILAGLIAARDRLPSTRELAVTLSVSRSTVAQAYEQLISEGYLETARGSGTFVSRELPDRPLRPDPGGRRGIATPRSVALSRYGSGLREDHANGPKRRGFVCFSQWEPDREHFPWKSWRRLLSRHSQIQGDVELRCEIAAYVGRSRGVDCSAAQILVVNGSQQGLDLCARLLFDRGDRVIVENPGYPGAMRTFRAYGAVLQPAAVDHDGIVCRDLRDDARVVYVTPSHQYPTGASMSLNRRLELLAWARRRAAVIIEDDYDSEYRYRGAPLPALQGLARDVPVIYCGTFSKVMFPGLRIGYLILPDALMPAFAGAKRWSIPCIDIWEARQRRTATRPACTRTCGSPTPMSRSGRCATGSNCAARGRASSMRLRRTTFCSGFRRSRSGPSGTGSGASEAPSREGGAGACHTSAHRRSSA